VNATETEVDHAVLGGADPGGIQHLEGVHGLRGDTKFAVAAQRGRPK
jgi:hypothetical protein